MFRKCELEKMKNENEKMKMLGKVKKFFKNGVKVGREKLIKDIVIILD